MKLQVLSDLHLEFYRDEGFGFVYGLNGEDVDGLVLAGDIYTLKNDKACKALFRVLGQKFKKVFYVPGNHEFYGTSVEFGDEVLAELQEIENIVLLQPDRPYEYMGKRLLGGTMWFPFSDRNGEYSDLMNDFYLIKNFTPWVYDQDKLFKKGMDAHLKEGDVVVTHHLPSPISTPKRYVGQPLNRFFVNNVEDLILDRKPALWIHGHTHDACDYKIGSTRILCNPRGYPNSREIGRNGFVNNLVVEI